MRISDQIAEYIQSLMEKYGYAEIRRNELAGTLGCVPSQINYVLTSRFTPEQGYRIESRRGGGGYVRIMRITQDADRLVMHIINSIGDRLDCVTARAILSHLIEIAVLDQKTAGIMNAAIADRALQKVPQELRDDVRASLFKAMLLSQM